MNFTAKLDFSNLATSDYPVLVAPAFDEEPMVNHLAEVDRAWRGALAKIYKSDVITKENELTFILNPTGKGIARIVFIGMGARNNITTESVRRAAGIVSKTLRKRNFSRIVFLTEAFIPENESIESTAYALIEGSRLGAYYFDRFKSEKEKQNILTVELHLPPRLKNRFEVTDLGRITTITTSTILARDWNNTPANLATPSNVARLAADVAREAQLSCNVLERKDCEKLGMGAFLAVAKGSNEPPKFIILEYRPKKFNRTLCLIGKALTFDTGGICIKPAANMEEMKADKGGGIAVISTMRAVGLLKPQGIRIVGIIPATENMPGGSATKPGDIVKTQSGKSIEIINTDAEGRLILADGLEYAIKEYEPDLLIDIATLTGACVIALGTHVAGVWTPYDEIFALINEASRKTGEQVWRMPLVKEYYELLKSDVADSKNVGGQEGGAIIAALFLKQFVGDTPWMHIDIAGPTFSKNPGAYIPKGATGFGPRLLYAFIEEYLKRM